MRFSLLREKIKEDADAMVFPLYDYAQKVLIMQGASRVVRLIQFWDGIQYQSV